MKFSTDTTDLFDFPDRDRFFNADLVRDKLDFMYSSAVCDPRTGELSLEERVLLFRAFRALRDLVGLAVE